MSLPTEGAQRASRRSASAVAIVTIAVTVFSPLVEAPAVQALTTRDTAGSSVSSLATVAAPRTAPASTVVAPRTAPVAGLVASRTALLATASVPSRVASSGTGQPAPAARVPDLTRAAPDGQGSCGTNWPSHKVPPETIDVLRTKTGKVQRVDFRSYVATVMASGEFPTWLPPAVLQVGATAVKQYAWYYAMDGHHRSGYKTASGDCYDVMDDTNDQLFHPEWADPTQKQLDALAATWDLTLRKDDRFFLTGYRYGDSVGCAKDADGWHLYEQSMQACADKGWSRQQIQEAYYAPHVTFVWNDGSGPVNGAGKDRKAPVAVAPKVQLRTSVVLGGSIAAVSWSASDSGSGVAAFKLQHSVDGGAWQDVALPSAAARSVEVSLRLGTSYRFRVLARDGAGNVSDWAASASVTPHLLQASAGDPARWLVVGAGCLRVRSFDPLLDVT